MWKLRSWGGRWAYNYIHKITRICLYIYIYLFIYLFICVCIVHISHIYIYIHTTPRINALGMCSMQELILMPCDSGVNLQIALWIQMRLLDVLQRCSTAGLQYIGFSDEFLWSFRENPPKFIQHLDVWTMANWRKFEDVGGTPHVQTNSHLQWG